MYLVLHNNYSKLGINSVTAIGKKPLQALLLLNVFACESVHVWEIKLKIIRTACPNKFCSNVTLIVIEHSIAALAFPSSVFLYSAHLHT